MNGEDGQHAGQLQRRSNRDRKEVYISEASMHQYQSPQSQPHPRGSGSKNTPNQNSGGGNSNLKSNTISARKPGQNSEIQQSPGAFMTGVDETQDQQKSQPPPLRLKLMRSSMGTDSPAAIESPTRSDRERDRKPTLYIQIESKFNKISNTSGIGGNEQSDSKWMEFKIIGRNIPSRSRSAVAVIDGYLYVYGGYELTLGSISDFWRINLASEHFTWEKVKVKGKLTPGPKCRMSSAVQKGKFYLFGGLSGSSISNNDLWCFDLKQESWSLIKQASSTSQDSPPCIDSHCSVVIGTTMYILFGYLSESASLSNAVYSFDFESSSWKQLFRNTPVIDFDGKATAAALTVPKPRFESAVTAVNSVPDTIFAFGGTDGSYRLNDLWSFNVKTKSYTEIKVKSNELPKVRSGHQMFSVNNQLIILGGLHDITWELDDMHAFDLKKSAWVVVNSDSARRRDRNQQSLSPDSKKGSDAKVFGNRTRKRGQTMSYQSSPLKRSSIISPRKSTIIRGSLHSNTILPMNSSSMVFENETASPTVQSPTKLEEKKRKDFLVKKANMLQTFEIVNPTDDNFRDLSPTSEAMKNSLNSVGNPMPSLKVRPGRLSEFGRVSISKFLEPLSENGSTRQGKRPCARDGHRVAMFGTDRLVVFGGDRHNMSFHDIYGLNLVELQTTLNNNNNN